VSAAGKTWTETPRDSRCLLSAFAGRSETKEPRPAEVLDGITGARREVPQGAVLQTVFGRSDRLDLHATEPATALFKGRHFEAEIIVLCVRTPLP
jgi:hypothetical protein